MRVSVGTIVVGSPALRATAAKLRPTGGTRYRTNGKCRSTTESTTAGEIRPSNRNLGHCSGRRWSGSSKGELERRGRIPHVVDFPIHLHHGAVHDLARGHVHTDRRHEGLVEAEIDRVELALARRELPVRGEHARHRSLQIARAHRGEIRVATPLIGGAEIEVTLPLVPSSSALTGRSPALSSPLALPSAAGW